MVTLSRGKSSGRHRIQYWIGGPLGLFGSGALMITAWFSIRLSWTARVEPVLPSIVIVPPEIAANLISILLVPDPQRQT